MGVGVDEDILVPADEAGDGARHRAEAEIVDGAGFGPAELRELLLELEVERRGAGERPGAERRADAVLVGDGGGGGDRLRMHGEAEVVVGRHLDHVAPAELDVRGGIVEREDAVEDVVELVEIGAGRPAHAAHEDVTLLEQVGHQPLASHHASRHVLRPDGEKARSALTLPATVCSRA